MRISLLASLALAGALGACNGSTSPYGGGTGGGTPGANQVFMQNLAFNPTTRTVAVGTTVQWVNQDGVTHTVTKDSGPGAAFNQSLGGGASFSVTFDSAGTYQYHCTIHGTPGGGMHGTIVVQ